MREVALQVTGKNQGTEESIEAEAGIDIDIDKDISVLVQHDITTQYDVFNDSIVSSVGEFSTLTGLTDGNLLASNGNFLASDVLPSARCGNLDATTEQNNRDQNMNTNINSNIRFTELKDIKNSDDIQNILSSNGSNFADKPPEPNGRIRNNIGSRLGSNATAMMALYQLHALVRIHVHFRA